MVAGAVVVLDDAFTAALGFDGADAAVLVVVVGFLLKKLKIIFNLIGLECPE